MTLELPHGYKIKVAAVLSVRGIALPSASEAGKKDFYYLRLTFVSIKFNDIGNNCNF